MTASQQWVKSHTRDLNDPRYIRLTWAQRGILDALARWSKAQSTVPGLFVRDDKPLPVADIALGIGARSADDHRLIAAAFAAFVAGDLMTYDDATGYELAGWDKLQSGTATEGRAAWRDRKRAQRARAAAQKARDRRRVAGQPNVTPLRPRDGDR